MARFEEATNVKGDDNIQLRYYRRYGWCACGFGLTWALLTCCFLIINIIVFIEPQWIGDTLHSPGVGYVGLFQLCEFVNFGSDRVCDGAFQDFGTILTDAFRASTFFIGVSCLIIMLCILLFLLFLCVYATYVYIICGTLQIVSTVFMFLGCVIFPAGWDHQYVRRICGNDVHRHAIGQCEMRWAYILAIVGIFDILMLAILAFVLAAHQRSRWANVHTVKQQKQKLVPADSREGTTARSTKSRNPKGYVLDVTGSAYNVGGSQAPPPSYHGGAASRIGGRSGMYGSQPVYIVDQDPTVHSEYGPTRRGYGGEASVAGGRSVPGGVGQRYRTDTGRPAGERRMRHDSI